MSNLIDTSAGSLDGRVRDPMDAAFIIGRARILFRRRWYAFAPLFLLGLTSFVAAELWPIPYVSEALIVVEEQKVPEQYVVPNVRRTLQTRLDAMTQRVLSRARLQQVIEGLSLYTAERAKMPMDDVIDQMRDEISIAAVQGKVRNSAQDMTGFHIRYSSPRPAVAQRVVNKLTSLFIEESARTRMQQSLSTTEFLDNQVSQAQKALEVEEEKLREYKTRYVGSLPEQHAVNIQMLQSLESQLQGIEAARERTEQQRIYIESVLRERDNRQSAMRESAPQRRISADRLDAETLLAKLQTHYAEAQTRYTSQHPDTVALRARIAAVESRLAALEKAEQDVDPTVAANPRPPVADPMSDDLRSRLKAIDAEIAARNRAEPAVRARISAMQAVLKISPVREQELSGLVRSYETSRNNYQSLLQKKMQSELASNLETRQQGEQFRLIDPATLPTKRKGQTRIILMGWLGGLVFGAALLMTRDFLDGTVRDKFDVVRNANVPVLVAIPVVTTRTESIAKRWVWAVEIAAAAVLTVVSLAGAVHHYLSA